MINPRKPKNEAQRLEVLHNLHILDTSSEERFDRIARVAQHLFHVPIALVSFIDKEREWYKSKNGLQFHEVPRDISFGGHAILEEDIMIVNDTLSDPRFKDNPLVTGEPGIRFYLGCPLKNQGKFNIGTLSLIDSKSKQLDDFDLTIIKELASSIEAEFEEQHVSTIDPLTKISNREGLVSIGKQVINRCNQFDYSALLIYFDLHKLKFINDNYGRDEGDKLLKLFAQQLLKNFRQTDVVARLGGDKFCVLCSGMNEENFPNAIKRFKDKLSLIPLNHHIEFSAGSVQYKRWKHHSIHYLIEEADEKIYEHKRDTH